ncbi:uncharacterized protein NPIL_300281, partial [Nephila pilipes]
MEPTKRTISEILFEDEDMPFDSDDEIITECSQDFLEASPFFEDLPSQFGNGMELEDAIILEERSRRRRRQVAKLALNSFWGRWGMNLNKTKLSYVNSVPDFNRYLSDPTKNIKDIFLPSEE